MTETLTVVRATTGLDCYVQRVFKNDETALRWRNRQDRIIPVVRLQGKWHVGDRVPLGTPKENIDHRYLTQE